MCMKASCWVCVKQVALDAAAGIGLAQPEHAVRLSLVGEDPTQISGRVNKLREALRAGGQLWQDAYHVHRNPAGTGMHVHLWGWGRGLHGGEVCSIAQGLGMGLDVDLRPAFVPAPNPGQPPRITYGMRACIDRPVGVTAMWPEAAEYLAVNGGKVVHATRGFWRDATTGRPLGSARRAVTAANKMRFAA